VEYNWNRDVKVQLEQGMIVGFAELVLELSGSIQAACFTFICVTVFRDVPVVSSY
jgi:hypothetical protein